MDLWGDVRAFESLVCEQWIAALNTIWDLHYAQRRAELKPGGAKNRGFNSYGIHEVSHAWGCVNQCERLLPELLNAEASLQVIREEAVRQAEEDALTFTKLGLVIDGAAA
jgi:hypothetical protein